MLELYYMRGACSLADHIVLEWVGAAYVIVEMDNESIKSPSYLALNAGATVPLLRHDDFFLTENVAILHYLAELYPSAGLLGGTTPRSRAEVMRWLAFLNSDVHKAFAPLFSLQKAAEADQVEVERVAAARRQIRQYLERLDAQLDGNEWLVGTRSVADPYLFVIFRWTVTTGVDFEGLPNLTAFAERMFGDDGVRAALFAEGALLF